MEVVFRVERMLLVVALAVVVVELDQDKIAQLVLAHQDKEIQVGQVYG